MADVNNVNTNISPLQMRSSSSSENGMNINAHYTSDMKVKRSRIDPGSLEINVPKNRSMFSVEEADKNLRLLNTDIFEAHKKEKANNEFNFRTFFKIGASFVLAAAGIACVRKIIRFFKK